MKTFVIFGVIYRLIKYVHIYTVNRTNHSHDNAVYVSLPIIRFHRFSTYIQFYDIRTRNLSDIVIRTS